MLFCQRMGQKKTEAWGGKQGGGREGDVLVDRDRETKRANRMWRRLSRGGTLRTVLHRQQDSGSFAPAESAERAGDVQRIGH
jgi:hypothetical protein